MTRGEVLALLEALSPWQFQLLKLAMERDVGAEKWPFRPSLVPLSERFKENPIRVIAWLAFKLNMGRPWL